VRTIAETVRLVMRQRIGFRACKPAIRFRESGGAATGKHP
jgi:hypothetical protein